MTDPPIPGITPEAILAYLDGEDLPHVAAYLRASPEGAALASEYRALQGDLARALYRHDCPTTQQLGDYALRLPWADQVAIAAHVTACPHCTGELAQLRAFLATEEDAPPLSLGERARRVIAAVLAPPPVAAPIALRGSSERQTYTYQAGDITVTIDVASGSRRDRRTLTGLVWRDRDDAPPLDGAIVALTGAGGTERAAVIDELGNFQFDELPTGDHRLEIALAGEVVTIEHLRVNL